MALTIRYAAIDTKLMQLKIAIHHQYLLTIKKLVALDLLIKAKVQLSF